MENNFKGQALNLNVVVLEKPIENKTASGIDMSGLVDKNERWKGGEVVSVGSFCPKKEDGTLHINVGDFVIFDHTKGSDFTQNGVRYVNVYFQDLFLKM